VTGQVEQRPVGGPVVVLYTLPPGDSIGSLRFCAGQVWFTSLNTGTVGSFDPIGNTLNFAPGVANIFDLAVTSSGDVLLSANPSWPAPGSNSGIWLAGASPRLLLQLQGPSGPLCLLPNGDLVVAEIPSVFPPPAGAVRLLRFPAARLAAAIAGATLGYADADATASGWNGAYGLAADDLGCVYVADPSSATLLRSLPGQVAPDPVPVATFPYSCLQLQFVANDPASAFQPFQPRAHASSLLCASTDFFSNFEVDVLHPERPQLAVLPGPTLHAGPAQFPVSNGPAGGLAVLAVGGGPPLAESLAAIVDGAGVWLGLPMPNVLVVGAMTLDSSGAATFALSNPGGISCQLVFQALTLGQPGSAVLGTTDALLVTLLP
jgi:hypothetical protein